MSLIESLVKLFPALKSIDVKLLNNVHFSLVQVTKVENNPVINLNDLSIENRHLLLSTLPKALSEGHDILPTKFETKAIGYSEKIELSSNKQVLEFFTGKIPDRDLVILKASLYLRSVLQEGGNTEILKQDIISQWGNRGKNISNLCSGNYFESWFRPLYEEMSRQSGFMSKKFINAYNEMVDNSPFALFVHHGMNQEHITEQITSKIEAMEKYGIKTLNIHGIGTKNVKTINKVLEKLDVDDRFEKGMEQQGGIIVIRLIKRAVTSHTS